MKEDQHSIVQRTDNITELRDGAASKFKSLIDLQVAQGKQWGMLAGDTQVEEDVQLEEGLALEVIFMKSRVCQ